MKSRLGRIPAHFYIFTSSLALFLFSLQRNFSAAHDSITYLNHIAEGKHLFHPHHLLYNFIGRAWLLAGKFLVPTTSDYILIEILSAVFGSAVLTICFLFFRNRAKLSSGSSSISTAVIAFSYGVWSYSTNIEVYAPPIFFALLVLYTITSPAAGRNLLQTALYTALAILFHQVHVLLVPVTLLYLSRTVEREQHLKLVTHYFLPVVIIPCSVYLFVAFQFEGVGNITELVSWITLYAHDHDYWRAPSLITPVLVATGFFRAFIGGQFLFSLPGISHSSASIFQGHNLADERFLVRNLEQWQAVVLIVLVFVALSIMLKLIIDFFRHGAFRNPGVRPLQYAFIAYSCFFFFWMPENLEFWILQSILFWMILFSSGSLLGINQQRVLAGIIAACLFIINYAGSIFWLGDRKNDWYFSAVQPLVPIATSSDLVISKDPWIMNDYVHYYTDSRQPVNQDQKSLLPDIQQTLQAGKRVFIIDAQDPNSSKAKLIDSTLQSYSLRMKLFFPGKPQIYIIR